MFGPIGHVVLQGGPKMSDAIPVFSISPVVLQPAKKTRPIAAGLLAFDLNICHAPAHSFHFYGRPLSVSGRPCYILPMFFVYLFIFLWPPYSPALVNGGSRKFYTWWTLSVIREVSSWIFSWSPLNYRVDQKVTKFGVFSDRTRKLSPLTPERGRIL